MKGSLDFFLDKKILQFAIHIGENYLVNRASQQVILVFKLSTELIIILSLLC